MRLQTTHPVDLLVVVALAAAASVAVLQGAWPPVRIVLGTVLLLFAPGYAVVAALFPERHRTFVVRRGEDGEAVRTEHAGLDPLTRGALSFGVSVALVPLVGLALNHSPWGVRLVPVVTTTTGLVGVAAATAWWRRTRLDAPARPRFALASDERGWSGFSTAEKALTVLLALALVGAGGALAHVMGVPRPTEPFTEFHVLDASGRAEDYPTHLARGEEGRVILGIGNHEGATTTYEVRVVAERGQFAGEADARSFHVNASRTLDAWTVHLPDAGSWQDEVTFTLDEPGTYRVAFLLDRGGADASPYRHLHLWVTVTE